MNLLVSDFSQPDFYRFNEDSLKLIQFVQSRLPSAESILDLGAGCGIIGIELAARLHAKELCLLEAQADYAFHLHKNVSERIIKCNVEVVVKTFGEWYPKVQYDLIVSNPPYFLPGHGRPSQNSKKNIARSFVLDSWDIFLDLVNVSLLSTGRAFLVLRNDPIVLEKIAKHGKFKTKVHAERNLMYVELLRLNEN